MFLVAKPELKTLADLRRKIIGFAGYGDSTEFMLRAILRQAGMELEKDVQAFQVSGSGQRLQALLSGRWMRRSCRRHLTSRRRAKALSG